MKLKDFDFRLWHKPSKSFIEIRSSFLTTNGRDEIVFEKSFIIPIDDESVEIELWSGYTDSKGERIYENDIIRTDKSEIFSVVADGEITAWGLLDSDGSPCCSIAEVMFESDRVEVIGNIHENLELLHQKG